jgi:predicted transcriptional regulator/uncharacterized short protein YbdD (DUF466 family)
VQRESAEPEETAMATTKLTAAQAVANHLSTDPDSSHEITSLTITTHAWKTVRETLHKMSAAGHLIVTTTDDAKRYMITEAGLNAYAPQADTAQPAVQPAPAAEIDPEVRAAKMEKIRKLLALAENASTTQDERDGAMMRATKLMIQYQIAESEVHASAQDTTPAAIVERRIAIFSTGGYAKERVLAMHDAAVAYGVAAYVTIPKRPSKFAPSYLNVIGTEQQVSALEILIPSLVLQMENAARKAWKDARSGRVYGPNELSAHRYRVIRDVMIGFGLGVAKQIESVVTEVADESTGAALVLASDYDRANAQMAETHPDLRLITTKTFDDDALAAGIQAGREADFANAGSRLNNADDKPQALAIGS